MNNKLLIGFSVDKENKKIKVDKEFAASLDKVWAAWTQSELLDQWWAPKPYRAETKSMDFREGGTWMYAMVSPKDEKQWCRMDYKNVRMQKSFSATDSFCDEQGNPTDELPGSIWTNSFSPIGDDTTMVNIVLDFDSVEDLEKIIETGFQEGFTAGLHNLDELLAS